MAHVQKQCSEIREQLHAFADGELEPKAARELERDIEGCPDCKAELTELRAVMALAHEAVNAPAADVDLAGFYDGVMARIAAEDAAEAKAPAARDEAPGLMQRLSAWLGELVRFERPMAAAGVAFAMALAVGALWYAQQGANGGEPGGVTGPQLVDAEKGQPKGGPMGERRGMETENSVAGRNQAFVESFEVAEGRVVIDVDEDGEQPTVVWHLTEEGEPAPAPDAAGPEQGL